MLLPVQGSGLVRWVWMLGVSLLPSPCPKEEPELAPAPEAPYPFTISAFSEPGHPVAGVRILLKTKPIGSSNASGLIKAEVPGTEGDTVALVVQCPDGYAAPERPIVMGLRRLAPGSPPPRFEAVCTPVLRTMVVGLRAPNGPNLPILHLGREVGRTDALGAAHFILQLKPGEQVALTVSTAEKGAEALRPQNPTLTFVSKDQDDVVLLEQKFTVEHKRIIIVKPRPGPTPL